MKNNFMLLFFLLALLPCQAQECYQFLRQKGIEAFENTEFATALQKFEGAQDCPDLPTSNDLNVWIGKTKRRLHPPKPKPVRATPALVEKRPEGEIRWTEGMVEAKGQCVVDRTRFPLEAQAVLMARRGAELVAKSNLLEMIQGIFISRRTTVRDFIVQSDDVEGRSAGVLRMARFVGEPVVADGMVEVTMQAPLQQLNAWLSPGAPFAATFQDTMEQVLYVGGTLAHPTLYPILTDETGAVRYNTETRFRQTGRQVFQYGQSAVGAADAFANLQAMPNPDNSLRISDADWPLLFRWLEAAEQGIAAPVRLAFP